MDGVEAVHGFFGTPLVLCRSDNHHQRWSSSRGWRSTAGFGHGRPQEAPWTVACVRSVDSSRKPQTTAHLLLACVFVREEVWWRALHSTSICSTWLHQGMISFDNWWLRERSRIPASLSRAFDSLILLITWSLWKESGQQGGSLTRSRSRQ